MRKLMLHAVPFAVAVTAAALMANETTAQQTETASQRRMAEMMAQQTDIVWEQEPEPGLANIRILMVRDDVPFSGKVSIHTEFSFRAVQRGSQSAQGFNPNENGRWVYEGLEPGTYELQIVGAERFDGFTWTNNVTLASGDKLLFEIVLP